MSKIFLNFDGLVGLQNCMDILKSEPGSHIGTRQMSSDDENQVVCIKVEGVTGIKVEEDPGPATSTGIKADHTVSLSVCIQGYVQWNNCCELNVESDVNIQFTSFLDMLYHYCDTACLVKVVYLKESHIKIGLLREVETLVRRCTF
jgi:hypothetical protein